MDTDAACLYNDLLYDADAPRMYRAWCHRKQGVEDITEGEVTREEAEREGVRERERERERERGRGERERRRREREREKRRIERRCHGHV